MLSELLPIFLFHLALTALPAAAAILFALQRGVRSVPILLAIALAATGLLAMASFWLYYAEPIIGKAASLLIPALSLGVAGICLFRTDEDERRVLRQLAIPFGLWGLGSAFVLFLGFAHGGLSSPIGVSINRFSHPLPSDSSIPYFYSNWFYSQGHHGSPPLFPGGWLSSDRPPLQIGYVLSQRPGMVGNIELHYQVLGVILQQLWIVGVWALLIASRVTRVSRACTVVTLLTSGLILVNGFFVWPKLLPAAMLLAAVALIVTVEWTEVRASLGGAVLLASLIALALLGHGSSAFMAVPLLIIVLIRRGFSLKWLAVGAVVGAALLAPWSAYQQYGDPPGNRLTNWMLGGEAEADPGGSIGTIIEGYREAGLSEVIDNKLANFDVMTGNLFGTQQVILELEAGADQGIKELAGAIRVVSFFFLIPSFGFLLIAPLAMLVAWIRRRYQRNDMRVAVACLGLTLLGCVVWGLLLFGNEVSRASIHVGSYVVPILAICGLVVGLRASFPRFAVVFLAANALFSLSIYAPVLEPASGSGYSVSAVVIAAVAFGGFVWLSWRVGTGSEDKMASPAQAAEPFPPINGHPSSSAKPESVQRA